jgi:peptide deformylase
MLKLVKFPDSILARAMPDFDFSNPVMDPKELERSMIDFMCEQRGIGLAANQVGIETRVFVMGNPNNPEIGKAFFNPIIEEVTEDSIELTEGCLSFPNIFVKVKRPLKIKARWQNSNSDWEVGQFEDYACKCFLHEFDHLNGITFHDRVSTLKWALAVKKSRNRKS